MSSVEQQLWNILLEKINKKHRTDFSIVSINEEASIMEIGCQNPISFQAQRALEQLVAEIGFSIDCIQLASFKIFFAIRRDGRHIGMNSKFYPDSRNKNAVYFAFEERFNAISYSSFKKLCNFVKKFGAKSFDARYGNNYACVRFKNYVGGK